MHKYRGTLVIFVIADRQMLRHVIISFSRKHRALEHLTRLVTCSFESIQCLQVSMVALCFMSGGLDFTPLRQEGCDSGSKWCFGAPSLLALEQYCNSAGTWPYLQWLYLVLINPQQLQTSHAEHCWQHSQSCVMPRKGHAIKCPRKLVNFFLFYCYLSWPATM